MTDSIWPNEYDQKICTWPKRSHRQTLTFWTWPKKHNNDEHQLLNMTENKKSKSYHYFGHIQPFKLVVLINLRHFKNFGNFHGYFGHVQPFMFVGLIFRSCSNVHVCRCSLSWYSWKLRKVTFRIFDLIIDCFVVTLNFVLFVAFHLGQLYEFYFL